MGRGLEHWILDERLFSLLDLRCVTLSPRIACGIIKFYVFGALRQLWQLAENSSAFCGSLISIAEAEIAYAPLLLRLLLQKKAATNIAFEVVIALFVPLPLIDRSDARLHIPQLLKYLLNKVKRQH